MAMNLVSSRLLRKTKMSKEEQTKALHAAVDAAKTLVSEATPWPKSPVKVCAISDPHEQWVDLTIPPSDLLVVAGDLTYTGNLAKISDFNNWARLLKENKVVKEVVVIAGNHDLTAEKDPETFRSILEDVVYLQDEEVTLCGLRIYGSPWTPSFFREHWVFNADRGPEIRQHWSKIPEGLDILVTHGPAYGQGDLTPRREHVGCKDLRDTILATKPRAHICGHIHYGYGISVLDRTVCVNASVCTEQYKPKNRPIVIDF
jgi:Icc-related predicted phosphoesterase